MIARTWYGDVSVAKSVEYRNLLQVVGLGDYLRVPGNRGGCVLEASNGDNTRFMLVSFWDSISAIRGYAGDNIEAPQYAPFDPDYLLSLEPTIQHHTAFGTDCDAQYGIIARWWHGAVPRSKADVYLDLMQCVALSDYKSVQGNVAAYVLWRTVGDIAHFSTLTFWESRDAISNFAGQDIAKAVYYDFDRHYLLEMEPTVTHYDVSLAPQ